MTGKSAAVVGFLANLLPLYDGEQHGGIWCARSMQDGTLVLPVDESDWSEERGTVKVRWQGDPARESLAEGVNVATIAVERYVRLHGTGAAEDAIAAELWFMARHFEFKTGCQLYLPQLSEPPGALVRVARAAMRFGGGVLVSVLKGSL